ncbi:MAG: gfo/Idh/MocA family oxidoreductase [Bacteroidetes bacterium]|nr:MAG: gfo/Idh/MocA family oxidoreductase [Bacteroidota bacterium]
MLKIGVLGVGHLGKIHLKCIGLTEDTFELIGFFDPDEANAETVSEQFGLKAFPDAQSLIDAVDVVDIVAPTSVHFEMAAMAIKSGKHVFIEKPLTHTLEEALELIKLSDEHKVKVQVGHVERFNPALLALDDMTIAPMFVEGHRLAVFNPRGTDVSVILDLMIHDLDILLSMVDSPVKEVSANGVAVVSNTPDITNARIVFENGCVANLTTSRISIKQMRKLRFFQKDAYVSLDFLDKEAQVVRLYDEDKVDPEKAENMMHLDTATGKKLIHIEMPSIEPVNAIKMELETFAESIQNDTPPRVSIKDGYKALELAHRIIDEVAKHNP